MIQGSRTLPPIRSSRTLDDSLNHLLPRLCLLLAAILAIVCPRQACAGGGPENVFVVVNASSWASLTVANHFIQVRNIPANNVLYLNWNGGFESTDAETFRREILIPALETAEKRGIYRQIDYIVYSSDFPYAINLTKDFADAPKLPAQASPSASINSATYLWNLLFLKTPLMMDFSINHYMRGFVKQREGHPKFDRRPPDPVHGFRSWYGWGNQGELLEAGGQPYMLSTMLAVTSGRGNSVEEAVGYLKRSAGADGTRPPGTIYFTSTSNIRSKEREDEFPAVIAALDKLGVRGQTISTSMPQGASDVAGLLSGAEDFSWAATRSTIVPGAICDNLTSFGGIMVENSSQTPLTEFLRYGAAGSAGTVIEPYLIANKFASANIFVYYASGCTLAESYYQAVWAPTQLLIVGDALCRPWANIPQVAVSGVEPGATVSSTVELKPQARLPRGGEIGHFELFVDGRRAGRVNPGETLTWDTTTDHDGYHELRVVAVESGPIASQGRAVIPVTVDNQGHRATMTTQPSGKVRWGQTLTVDLKAPGMKQIYVLNNGRLLGQVTGEQGQVKLNPAVLGLGPVGLQAVAVSGTAYRDRVTPAPVEITVEPPAPLPAVTPPRGELVPGLLLRLANNRIVPIQTTADPGWLGVAGVGANEPFIFQGYFDVDDTEVHQFQLWHNGSVKLQVDGKTLYNVNDGKYQPRYIPVNLAKGLHRLTVSGRSGVGSKLRILFGGPGSVSLNGQRFRHPKGS